MDERQPVEPPTVEPHAARPPAVGRDDGSLHRLGPAGSSAGWYPNTHVPGQAGAAPGWYPDPTGRFQVRWFDGGWTAHAATAGRPALDPLPTTVAPIQEATPSPMTAQRPAARGRWLLAGAAAAVVAVVAVAIVVSSGSDDTGQAADGTSLSGDFCTDAQSNWVRVNRAWTTADTIVERGVAVQDWASDQDLLVTTAPLAKQLADEAPDRSSQGVNFKTEYARLSAYLADVGALAGKQGGTETERSRIGREAPTVLPTQVDVGLTVTTGLPGSIC